MKKKSILILTMMVMMFVIASTVAYAATSDSQTSSTGYIDSKIQGQERQVMTQVMSTLAPEDRENAVYIAADGTIYANKPELKANMKSWSKVKDNIYMDQNNNTQAFPVDSTTVTNNTDDGSLLNSGVTPMASTPKGLYRRVSSKTGYSWQSSYVHFGTKTTDCYSVNNATETPYLYMGGTSSNGSEVDAGCQYSYTNNNWSIYLHTPTATATDPNRFKAGQNGFLKYYVSSANNVTLSVTAVGTDGVKKTESYTLGWNTNGSGCSLKRCTTIAQVPYNTSSGSYHKNVHWYSSLIGTSSSSNHTWGSSDTSAYTNFPDTSHVVVNFVSPAEETDNIKAY